MLNTDCPWAVSKWHFRLPNPRNDFLKTFAYTIGK